MTRIRLGGRTVAILIAVALTAGVVVATQLSPHGSVVRTYGPNVAATLLGVVITLGGVDYLLGREQKRLKAPAERAAVAAAWEVWDPLAYAINMSSQFMAAGEDKPLPPDADMATRARRWGELLLSADLTRQYGVAPGPGMTPVSFAEFIGNEFNKSMEAWRLHSGTITQLCPTEVATATQDLMQGRGNMLLRLLSTGQIGSFAPGSGADFTDGFVDAFIAAEVALRDSGLSRDVTAPAVRLF